MRCCRNCKLNFDDEKPCEPILLAAFDDDERNMDLYTNYKLSPDSENNCEYWEKKT